MIPNPKARYVTTTAKKIKNIFVSQGRKGSNFLSQKERRGIAVKNIISALKDGFQFKINTEKRTKKINSRMGR